MKVLNQLPKKAVAILPLIAVFILVGVVASRTTPVGAQQDPKQTRIESLTKKLQDAIADVQKNGEFTTDRHGEKVYAGETATRMEQLHKEVSEEINELQARPAAERAVTVNALNQWNDSFLYKVSGQPRQNVRYIRQVGGIQNFKKDGVEVYVSEDYAYQVDVATNKVLDAYIRPKEVGEPKEFMDMTPRYDSAQLEQMAKDVIASQNLGVDLDKLTLEKGQKIGTYFFTWQGENGKSLQVAFTQGGQLIGYTNAGFFDNL
ncbi:MAG: hypothetical protein UX21_C0051G0002 [Microgenomates group bacterium GW2011_GWC2_45_8]|nr:MAG: hypothetical protein UX21_C0051G0002 [Microgenomates group bacterium GW2011_GWC2_45_8]